MNPYAPPAPAPPPPAADPQKVANRVRNIGYAQLAFAALGVTGLVSTLTPQRDEFSRRLHDLMWSGELGAWMTGSLAANVVSSGILAASGYLLLKQRVLGRTLGLVHAAFVYVHQAVYYLGAHALMVDAMSRAMTGHMPGGRSFMKAFLDVTLVGSIVFSLIVELVFVILLTRPNVKAFLEAHDPTRARQP